MQSLQFQSTKLPRLHHNLIRSTRSRLRNTLQTVINCSSPSQVSIEICCFSTFHNETATRFASLVELFCGKLINKHMQTFAAHLIQRSPRPFSPRPNHNQLVLLCVYFPTFFFSSLASCCEARFRCLHSRQLFSSSRALSAACLTANHSRLANLSALRTTKIFFRGNGAKSNVRCQSSEAGFLV